MLTLVPRDVPVWTTLKQRFPPHLTVADRDDDQTHKISRWVSDLIAAGAIKIALITLVMIWFPLHG